ncbi:virion morphogenesis protein [uncultured Desulfovibrio sp.]|uniref:virion morphogenesis protein n=1 Tax=uncultured Desulfovibrio sp. TaxID=167968 RepID=UPI00266CCF5A|nr:virion morphogenesis protein [uncultured Desulfovibrio sp.]
MKFGVRVLGDRQLNAQLDRFAREARERQKLARRMGGYVRTLARRNIKRRRTVDGAAMTPRQKRRELRPMLMGLHSQMVVRAAEGNQGVNVSWDNALMAAIGYRHQEGIGENWSPGRARKVYGQPNYKARATRKQAKALLREGYRLMVPAVGGGRRPKRVTVQWIEQKMTLGQAGLILRLIRTGQTKGKQSWRDTVPARPFLGVTPQQAEDLSQKLVKSLLKAART